MDYTLELNPELSPTDRMISARARKTVTIVPKAPSLSRESESDRLIRQEVKERHASARSGNSYVYPMLNWLNPGPTVVLVLLSAFGIILMFCAVAALPALRDKLSSV